MRKIFGILLILSLCFCSCSEKQDNIVIFKEFNNQEWKRFEYLSGGINVKKTSQKYDIVMEIVVNDDYPNVYELHQNDCPLLFNLAISDSEGNNVRSRNYKFMLKDKDGNWKADKKNGYYTFKLPIISEMNFNEQGAYDFLLENKYPKDPLQGVKSITVKCTKSSK